MAKTIAQEKLMVKRIIDSGIGYPPTGKPTRGCRRGFAKSSVEEAVIERETSGLLSDKSNSAQKPDPRLEVLNEAIKDPSIRQAMDLRLGLTDGKQRSRVEIAREMRISGPEVDNLIKNGVEILQGPK